MSETAACLEWWQDAKSGGELELRLPPQGGPEIKRTNAEEELVGESGLESPVGRLQSDLM